MGHLIIAEDARAALELDEVLFIPAGQPWFKSYRRITDTHHRLAMARLAVADNPRFSVSDIEIRRSGPSYTVDTLGELREHSKYAGAEFIVILGVDALREIDRWHQPRALFELSSVVGMARPAATVNLSVLHAAIPGSSSRISLLDSALVDISGTDIRRRVAEGRSIRYRVPAYVEQYIHEHGLYLPAS
ncbi:MAG: nicotinate (nicotinamide) nucleotide adenylyltransferase [Chloroflexi bacterium]|nr:nicotinate (nicotinamide) nucleotide adenylyltransferase [Chloroflexota bacterium]